NGIRAAVNAGVRQLVKLSALGASDHSKSVIGLWHNNVERTLKATDLEWTSLRPHAFMQNFLGQAESIRNGQIFSAAGDGQVPFVDTRDIAAVAAEILANGGFAGKKPVLTGPEALSFKEVAHVLSKVLGRDVEHVAGTDDEAWERLRSQGQSPWLASGQIALYGYW